MELLIDTFLLNTNFHTLPDFSDLPLNSAVKIMRTNWALPEVDTILNRENLLRIDERVLHILTTLNELTACIRKKMTRVTTSTRKATESLYE